MLKAKRNYKKKIVHTTEDNKLEKQMSVKLEKIENGRLIVMGEKIGDIETKIIQDYSLDDQKKTARRLYSVVVDWQNGYMENDKIEFLLDRLKLCLAFFA